MTHPTEQDKLSAVTRRRLKAHDFGTHAADQTTRRTLIDLAMFLALTGLCLLVLNSIRGMLP